MTIREYLRQAYRLDQRINSELDEKRTLREMFMSTQSPQMGEKVQTSKNGDPPFIRYYEKMLVLEERITSEIDKLIDLKEQIRQVISEVEDTDEQMVLRYRYIHNMSWEQIGIELNADRTTVYRWHNLALRHVKMPEDPIII